MFILDRNKLEVRFPDVHPRAKLTIEFQRTLRVPDDNRDYPLPAGLGRFPVRHVEDYPETTPDKWKEHGGVLIPMYQSEALWINFQADYPMAVKVAAGKINAVTGKPFTNQLSADPQDYLVVPEQPWLDGFCIRKGMVRQFVAMPLGEGFTAEEQLTGEATHGGIQLICYPMEREKYEELFDRPQPAMKMSFEPARCYSVAFDMEEMGLAPGGMIRQQIHEDPYGLRAWDLNTMSRCFVHLANSEVWQEITGEAPPESPITKERYLEAGIPWFDFYFADAHALQGSERLAGLDSVAGKTIKKGAPAEELSAPVVVGETIDLSSRKVEGKDTSGREKAMQSIEIDFDVYKKLTAMRETESVTYNDVLRRVLSLGADVTDGYGEEDSESSGISDSGAWTVQGVKFPKGTEFRASYKGQTYTGRVEAGQLAVNGQRFTSPSAAAVAITRNSVNGWVFWECRKPGSTAWTPIKSLRKGV